MLLSMYFSNSSSVIPFFLFIPIVHGQIISSAQPNLPHVSKVWVKNSNRIFSLSSAVTLVGNWKCGGTHSPAALLPNIPVHVSHNFAVDLLVNGRWGSWNDTAGVPPTLVLLASREIYVSSMFIIRCNCASVNVGSPLSPTPAKSNSIKKARKCTDHASRLAYVVHRTRLSSTAGDTSAFDNTFVDFITRS